MKEWDRRHPTTQPREHGPLDDIAVTLSVLRINTVRDLKTSERGAVEEYLGEIVSRTKALRGAARYDQERYVRGIILLVQRLVLHLENM